MQDIPTWFIDFFGEAQQVAALTAERRRRSTLLGPNLRDCVVKTVAFRAFEEEVCGRDNDRIYARQALVASGFLNSLDKGGLAVEDAWNQLRPYFRGHSGTRRSLLLLDGCRFPVASFRALDHEVRQFTREELDALRPEASPSRRDMLSEYWFLVKEGTYTARPGTFSIPWLAEEITRDHWEPLAAISLFRSDCFSVPVHLLIDEGWETTTLNESDPKREYVGDPEGDPVEVPLQSFEIEAEEWDSFADWIRRASDSIRCLRSWKPFRVAAQRFVRCTLESEPPGSITFDAPRFEQVFLWYCYSLDGILAFEGAGNRDKIATRSALLVGRDDEERKRIWSEVQEFYDQRSKVAHGADLDSAVNLPRLREIVRHVLVVVSVVAAERKDALATKEFIRDLAISKEAQRCAESARRDVRFALALGA